MSVTATDRADALLPGAGFSPTRVDVAAPGASFGSLDVVSFGRIENTFGGTSGATPQVAGAVALMYAAACERLVAQSLREPEAVARDLRARLLENVDVVADLRTRVASAGRLNVRRALEAVIAEEPCAVVGVNVQLGAGAVPPKTIEAPAVELQLSDTISPAWGLYRYEVSEGSDAAALLAARAATDVRLAAFDRPLLGPDVEYDFGEAADFLSNTGSAAARRAVAPSDASTTVSLFALGFAERPSRLLGHRAGDGRDLGLGGAALSSILEAVAGTEGVQVERYRGYRVSDWLRAASLASEQRVASGGEAGQHVFASAVQLNTASGSDPDALVGSALERMRAVGVLPVLAPEGFPADGDNRALFPGPVSEGGGRVVLGCSRRPSLTVRRGVGVSPVAPSRASRRWRARWRPSRGRVVGWVGHRAPRRSPPSSRGRVRRRVANWTSSGRCAFS